jgi:hypothetical protein
MQTITIYYPNSCFLPILCFQNFHEYFQDFHNISPIYFFLLPSGENLQKGIAGLIPQNPNLLGIQPKLHSFTIAHTLHAPPYEPWNNVTLKSKMYPVELTLKL